MTNYCFTVPILPGGMDLMKKWTEENIVNSKEHDAVMKAAGISREQVWIQYLRQGDFAVAIYETDNPEHSFRVLATSQEPWAAKFREHLKKAHGIDLLAGSSLPSINKMMVGWNEAA
jgi:hypothetical protein